MIIISHNNDNDDNNNNNKYYYHCYHYYYHHNDNNNNSNNSKKNYNNNNRIIRPTPTTSKNPYLKIANLIRNHACQWRADDGDDGREGVDNAQFLLRDAEGPRLQGEEGEHGHGR